MTGRTPASRGADEPDQPARGAVGSPWLMLAMATLGFAVNFWAWALISPLGPLFRDQGSLGSLSESDVALLVAVPVIVGSLGRIVVGALTDRFGGRLMFPIISGITIIPILFIAFVALDSYALLLVGGFFLGIAGTAFAVGVPFVNAWFPHRTLAAVDHRGAHADPDRDGGAWYRARARHRRGSTQTGRSVTSIEAPVPDVRMSS